MRVEVTKLTDIDLMQAACSFTINKESKMSLANIYKCGHSPIRTQLFWVQMSDIPTFVSVHLVRHSLGVTHYVKSNREDRVCYSGDLGRRQPVNHAMLINAEALINIARKRLCGKTHEETYNVVQMIKEQVAYADPDLARFMVAECVFRGNKCFELKGCGRCAQG